MTNWKTQLALLILFATSLSGRIYAQLTPSADSYTNTGSSSTNYGANVLLDVVGGSQITYIQFNLSSIPTNYTSTNVAKATLKLYVNAVTTAGNFNIDYVTSAWSESTITAKSSPTLGSTISSAVPLTTSSLNQYILVDITSAVQAWVNGTQANDGIALVGSGSVNASFDSKENTNESHAPELDIVFINAGPQGLTGPQGPQGIQGPQGPMGLTGATGATGATGPQGPQGPQGLIGPQGSQGPQGSTGPQGPAGTNGTGFNFRNAFDPTATYAVNDVVTYNGSTYIAIAANGPSTQTPDQNTSAWSLLAQQGATGPQGPMGLTGAVGPQGPAGATGASGATGPQGPQGLTGAQGPQGSQGIPGPTGPQGPAGVNGTAFNFRNAFDPTATYAVNDVVTYNGSTYIAIAANGPSSQTPDLNTSAWSVMAPQGMPGAQGAAGAPGLPGPTGPQGTPGIQGPPGATGSTRCSRRPRSSRTAGSVGNPRSARRDRVPRRSRRSRRYWAARPSWTSRIDYTWRRERFTPALVFHHLSGRHEPIRTRIRRHLSLGG